LAGLAQSGHQDKDALRNYQIAGVDVINKAVRIRSPEGLEFLVPKDEFELFKKTVEGGQKWPLHVESVVTVEADSGEAVSKKNSNKKRKSKK